MLDYESLNCPYCGSPTMVEERPQVNGKDGSMLFPYEVVLTCTSEHRQLDIADYNDKITQKEVNGYRRPKKILDNNV
tara:strand:+ start:1891 stop:2121 length:231 start_codon:yes stop_codon:yes gene_type:complete